MASDNREPKTRGMMMSKATIGDFFSVASPNTLASLLVDILEAGEEGPSELYKAAWAELEAIVGLDEANRLIGRAAQFA